MPIATPEVYAEMLDRAKNGSFAYPAINITSSQTVTAATKNDGIVLLLGLRATPGTLPVFMMTDRIAQQAEDGIFLHEQYPQTKRTRRLSGGGSRNQV